DISAEITKKIEEYCSSNNIPVAGKIPYDTTVFESVKNLMPITKYNCPASEALKECFSYIAENTGI
ncbi:MAG: hypothetical protein PHV39_03920, partial [Methanomicrobium sp.]|nr:hypothetical protein [Methanomicrobium sp.]